VRPLVDGPEHVERGEGPTLDTDRAVLGISNRQNEPASFARVHYRRITFRKLAETRDDAVVLLQSAEHAPNDMCCRYLGRSNRLGNPGAGLRFRLCGGITGCIR